MDDSSGVCDCFCHLLGHVLTRAEDPSVLIGICVNGHGIVAQNYFILPAVFPNYM